MAYVIFLGFFFFPNLIIQRYMFPIMANLKKLDKFPNSIYLVRSFFILFVGLLISGIGYVFSDFIFCARAQILRGRAGQNFCARGTRAAAAARPSLRAHGPCTRSRNVRVGATPARPSGGCAAPPAAAVEAPPVKRRTRVYCTSHASC